MIYKIHAHNAPLTGAISLSASKSESNRVLIMDALSGGHSLHNLSDARDTETMQRLLASRPEVWDVLDAGTTMRFCSALLGVIGTGQTITGTERMQQRPIKLLVDALRALGAEISYLGNEGYPPLQIEGIKDQKIDQIEIPGNVSSQYISALLMIAPVLPKGLKIQLVGEVYSRPYITMTLGLMSHFGIQSSWSQGNLISINPQSYQPNSYTVESDWSGASYWYSMVALQPGSKLLLKGLRAKSYQGDQEIAQIMNKLGVSTRYTDEGAELTHTGNPDKHIEIDFRTCPDLAQTVMVTAAMLGSELSMIGLESLKIKETDRIAAMAAELQKIGGRLTEDENQWIMTPGFVPGEIATIETYEDHRMAMAFAPIAMISDITIDDPMVVKKSYPGFWDHLKSVGIRIDSM